MIGLLESFIGEAALTNDQFSKLVDWINAHIDELPHRFSHPTNQGSNRYWDRELAAKATKELGFTVPSSLILRLTRELRQALHVKGKSPRLKFSGDELSVAESSQTVNESVVGPNVPALKAYLKGEHQVVFMGKFGRFNTFTCMPSDSATNDVLSLDDYQDGVKSGDVKSDPIIDDFDVDFWLTKISKAMDATSMPKQPATILLVPGTGHLTSASAWVYPGHAASHGGMTPIHVNRKPSPTATGKFKAWKGPRSPHTIAHEYAHQVYHTALSQTAKDAINDEFIKAKKDQTAALASKMAATPYCFTPASNNNSKGEEFYAENAGYSIYGTDRVSQYVLDYLSVIYKGKEPPASKGQIPKTTDDPKATNDASSPEDVYVILKKAGLATDSAPAPENEKWAKIFVGKQSSEFRQSVRKVFASKGIKAAGSFSGGGDPTLYKVANNLIYIKHPQGVAVGPAGMTINDLKESIVNEGIQDNLLTALRRAGGGEFKLGLLAHHPKLEGQKVKDLARAASRLSERGIIRFNGKNVVSFDEFDPEWEIFNEVSPPGFSGTVKAALLKHPDKFSRKAHPGSGKINPYAVFWGMYKKGARSHYKPDSKAKGVKNYISPKVYKKRRRRLAETLEIAVEDSVLDFLADRIYFLR